MAAATLGCRSGLPDSSEGRPPSPLSGRLTQHPGHLELDVFAGGFDLFHGHVIARTEGVDHLVDQNLGCRGPGGDAKAADALECPPVDVGGALDQLRIGAAGAAADLDQALAQI